MNINDLPKIKNMAGEEVINEYKKIRKELKRIKSKQGYARQAMLSYESRMKTATDDALVADLQKRYTRVKRDLQDLNDKVTEVQTRYDHILSAYNKVTN
jgi:predicted  nucleic acid-binding Zn-ribbon protein